MPPEATTLLELIIMKTGGQFFGIYKLPNRSGEPPEVTQSVMNGSPRRDFGNEVKTKRSRW